jgi:hypothetical protein
MLSYFLITWVVAFFAFCLPLLFITAKEKEAMRKTYDESIDELIKKYSRQVVFDSNNTVFEEHKNEYNKLTKKREDILFRTAILNTIFLFILPYVIFFEIKNSYYIISLIYFIFIIFFMRWVILGFGQVMGGLGPSDSDKLINNLIDQFFYGPGKFVVNLAVK